MKALDGRSVPVLDGAWVARLVTLSGLEWQLENGLNQQQSVQA
jgi:hypothetical protein